jgi:branched-chain amino acid transport system substrate-binding protein
VKKANIILIFLIILSGLFTSCEQEEETLKIGAIFAVTGGASFLGAPEARTAEMLTRQINDNGGVNGKKVTLIVKDSAGDPEKAISFAKQLIEEEKVHAIIGPSTSGETMQIKELCQKAETPLVSCAAAEAIVDPAAGYVFKTPQKDSYVARWIFREMQDRGIGRIGIIGANTGFGNQGLLQLETYAPDFGIEIAISESYDKASTDLTALLTKIKSRNVEAVVNWSIVPAQSIVPKNMKQLNMEMPLFQSHGFGNIKYVETAGEAAEGIIFPCGRLLVAENLPDDHPQKDVLVSYKRDYESEFNEPVSTFGGHAYDAYMVVIRAAESADSLEREKIREAIENISNYPLTGGIFTFSPDDHNGLGMDSLEMLTVENGQFALLEK